MAKFHARPSNQYRYEHYDPWFWATPSYSFQYWCVRVNELAWPEGQADVEPPTSATRRRRRSRRI